MAMKWKIQNIQFRDPVSLGNVSNDQFDANKTDYKSIQVEEKGAFLIFTGLPGLAGVERRVDVPLSNIVQITRVAVPEEPQPEKPAGKGREEAAPAKPLIGPGGQPLPAARGVAAGSEPAS